MKAGLLRLLSRLKSGRTKTLSRDHGTHADHSHPVKIRTQEEISAWVKKQLGEGGWQSFGYFPHDAARDFRYGHFAFFACCLATVVPIFWFKYFPDAAHYDWSHREAMILLREREEAGIFPIDKNFIDPGSNFNDTFAAKVIQCNPLNVITLGPLKRDNNY